MAGVSRNLLSLLTVLFIFFFLSFSEARDHLVGGKNGSWEIPSSSSSDSLNKWANHTRFLVGDYLVWESDGKKAEAVLQVNKTGYEMCNTSGQISNHSDGKVRILLSSSGPYYFISGSVENCKKGRKLVVVVLSESHAGKFFPPAAAPSPSLVEGGAAAAPASGAAVGLKGRSLVMGLGALVVVGLCE